jgi:hypothetical protein
VKERWATVGVDLTEAVFDEVFVESSLRDTSL